MFGQYLVVIVGFGIRLTNSIFQRHPEERSCCYHTNNIPLIRKVSKVVVMSVKNKNITKEPVNM